MILGIEPSKFLKISWKLNLQTIELFTLVLTVAKYAFHKLKWKPTSARYTKPKPLQICLYGHKGHHPSKVPKALGGLNISEKVFSKLLGGVQLY